MRLDFTRQPYDGQVSVEHTDDGLILLAHEAAFLKLSPYNAARILACLSMVLDLPLTKSSMKAIKM